MRRTKNLLTDINLTPITSSGIERWMELRVSGCVYGAYLTNELYLLVQRLRQNSQIYSYACDLTSTLVLSSIMLGCNASDHSYEGAIGCETVVGLCRFSLCSLHNSAVM
jgi:hypothetical protein